METICNLHVGGPNNVGRDVQTVAQRFGDHRTKEMLGVVGSKVDQFQTSCNNSQQHATTCNRVCTRTKHATPNNVGSSRPTMLRPFERGFVSNNKHFLSHLPSASQPEISLSATEI